MSDSKELVVSRPIEDEWHSKIELIKRTVAVGATNDELELFFHQAKRTGLDPLARQIYCIRRKSKNGESKMTIQVGIDGYRLIADRTGKYAGSDDYEFDQHDNVPLWARCTVWKIVQGIRCPFTATARLGEYRPPEGQDWAWNKMPHVQLGKCAEALALRKAFPADLAGTYIKEELDIDDREDYSTVEALPAKGKAKRPVEDVMCAHCRQTNKHAPDCPTQTQKPSQDASTTSQDAPRAASLSQIALHVTKFEERKTKTNKTFLIVTAVDQKRVTWNLYSFHASHRNYVPSWVGKACLFEISSKDKDGKPMHTIENVLKAGEVEYRDNKPILQAEVVQEIRDEDVPF